MGVHPAQHLSNFSGVMHADGHAVYNKLYPTCSRATAVMATSLLLPAPTNLRSRELSGI
ncbi:hypothetical protein RHIZ_20890 [Rhizobium skierniewicense]|nr:hypothetical protein [Rhizobium skierniewicense]